jgi:hypothetical protein
MTTATATNIESLPHRRPALPASVRIWILFLVAVQTLGCNRQDQPGPPAAKKTAATTAGQMDLPADPRRKAVKQIRSLGGDFVYPVRHTRVVDTDLDRLGEIDAILYFQPDHETHFRRVRHPRSALELTGSFVEPPFEKPPRIDDRSLACIAPLADLSRLSLAYNNIGDSGMEHVCRLQHLVYLNIDGTDVSDASVDRLKGLSNLLELLVRDTRLTEIGIAELRAALPQLTIHE